MILSAYLLPFTVFYLLAVTIRKLFSQPAKYGFQVISAGNLVCGGTGKTPLAMEIAKTLRTAGRPVAVASSGFRDETLMVRRNFSDIIFARKNRRGFESLGGFDGTVIMDDGFHCLNIMLLDASNPFDNSILLPAGLLREPKRYLREADVFIVTRPQTADKKAVESLYAYLDRFGKPVYAMDYAPDYMEGISERIDTSNVRGKNIIAFAGIGNPLSFFALLAGLSPEKITGVVYPDHFRYTERDINELCCLYLKKKTDCIVTTEKDYVKLESLIPCELPLFYLKTKVFLTDAAGKKTDFDSLLDVMVK